MKSLDQMVDGMLDHAKHILIGHNDEQVVPLFHIQFKNRPDAVMPAPWSNEREKSAIIRAIRMSLKAFKPSVVNYAFVSEVWMLKQDHAPRKGDLMPSESERRTECVIVSAGDHKGARMKAWDIIRDDKGVVTDLVEQKMGVDHFEGRLYNLLAED